MERKSKQYILETGLAGGGCVAGALNSASVRVAGGGLEGGALPWALRHPRLVWPNIEKS